MNQFREVDHMVHRIKKVRVVEDRILRVTFQSGQTVDYNVRDLCPNYSQFKKLVRNKNLFQQVRVDTGGYGISWNDEFDLAAEEIWENGKRVFEREEFDVYHKLATNLIEAREERHMTQRQLAEVCGVYQADISKIERGLANPSISTLNRLAEAMNMELNVVFVRKYSDDNFEYNTEISEYTEVDELNRTWCK